MFRTLKSKIGTDSDYANPVRLNRIIAYSQMLDGTIYDALPFEFHQERDGDRYVPLRDRAPSVRYNMCKTVVHDSVALLFGEGRFPDVTTGKNSDIAAINQFIVDTNLRTIMSEAAVIGSVGSVAVQMRVLNGRVYYNAMRTAYLTPVWSETQPDKLLSVTELYKVRGRDLAAQGYAIAQDLLSAMHWFRRDWNADAECWFVPCPVISGVPNLVDAARSVQHGLGFVPIVWIRNLPPNNGIDGDCTFAPAIESQIEIEYQLSQAGRGLKYSSDPTLVIKEPAAPGDDMIKSADNALVVSEKGDAKLLEIGGTAAAAVVEYVKALRELALETVHGNRASADKVSAAQSGRAMELSFQGLVWLTDKLRNTYGQGLLDAVELARQASSCGRIVDGFVDGKGQPLTLPEGDLALRWPGFFPPTHADNQADATALVTLINAGVISRQTATAVIAATYDIADALAERVLIEAEKAEDMKRAKEMQAQVKVTENSEP